MRRLLTGAGGESGKMIAALTRAALALVLVFAFVETCVAQEPLPPCAASAQPPYAVRGEPPHIAVLSGADAKRWKPATCTGWPEGERDAVVALAGALPVPASADQLLQRLGAVSQLQGARYWSVSDRGWRTLITASAALDGPDAERRRADFSAAELRNGTDHYFVQSDSRSTQEVVYRMRLREASPDRIVLETENVTAVRFLALPIFKAGALRSLYFIERLDGGRWGYYALVSASGAFAERNSASFVNRAVALYRRFAGVPDDAQPPAMP